MVRAKKIITIFILLLITFVSTNNVLASNFDEDTEANVSLKKSDSNTETNNNKKPIYTTSTPKKVDLLPQTGEILASFMYVMIGLSLLIFIIGLIFNKYSMNNIEWSY